MKTIISALLLGACVTAAHAQAPPSAKTSGTCSPALNGNNNVITIHCAGLSPQKADALIKIMNQILAKQLDLKQVNDQLSQIHSDVASLNEVFNPLDNATPEQASLLELGAKVRKDCTNFIIHWNQLTMNALQERTNPSSINQDEAARYKSVFVPEALSYRDQMLQQLPGESGSGVDYNVHTPMQLSFVCQDLTMLSMTYQQKLQVNHHDKSAQTGKQ